MSNYDRIRTDVENCLTLKGYHKPLAYILPDENNELNIHAVATMQNNKELNFTMKLNENTLVCLSDNKYTIDFTNYKTKRKRA